MENIFEKLCRYAIMSGYAVPASLVNFLSLRTLVVKLVGLVLASGAGLIIGKEGPLVAICCVIAQLLLRYVFSQVYFYFYLIDRMTKFSTII